MSLTSRAVRNVLRGRARTIGVAMIVGIALSLFLILSQINTSISASVSEVRAALKDVITIQAAGSGFSLSTHLNGSVVSVVNKVAGVASDQRVLLDVPNLGSPGSSPGSGPPTNFTLYEGIDTWSNITLFGGFVGSTSMTVTAGRALDSADENQENAEVGQQFAKNENLNVGSTLSVNGTTFLVVGVFSTGSSFSDDSVILPYPAAAAAFHVSGPNLLYVVVASGYSVDQVVAELSNDLGSAYNVEAAGQIGGGFGSGLSSILSSTEFESIAALAVGGAIMIVTMALVTSRRTKEIGLLKAFGFSNGKIARQLFLEGLIFASFGLPVGLLATVWLGPSVAQLISGTAFGGGPGTGRFAGGFLGTVSFALTPYEVLLGVAVTFGFGLVGSLYPIVRALRLKPAEALRHE